MDRRIKPRIRKYILLVALVSVFCLVGIVPAFAAESDLSEAEAAYSELYDALDDETEEALEEIGVTSGSYEELASLSPRKVVTAILDILSEKAVQPLRCVGLVCAFLVLGAAADGFLEKKETLRTVFSLFCILWIVLTVLQPITESIAQALSAVELGADFLLAYIPVFAGVIAMSGKPLLSAAYSSVMLGLSNLLSFINGKALLPLVQAFFMLHIVSSLHEKYTFDAIAAFLKRAVCIVLGFGSTIFTGLLSIKGALAASGDSVSVRGVKMLVSGTLPVVGSTLSEAYTSVLGSIGLIQNAVGVFGIVVIVLMHLPVILELLLWYLALMFAAAIGGMLGQTQIKKLLEGIAATVSLVNIFVIFNGFLLVISTGVILQFKG